MSLPGVHISPDRMENHDLTNPGKKRDLFPYMLIAPAVFAATVVVLIPIMQTMVMSFMQYIVYKPKARDFIGFSNYLAVLNQGGTTEASFVLAYRKRLFYCSDK